MDRTLPKGVDEVIRRYGDAVFGGSAGERNAARVALETAIRAALTEAREGALREARNAAVIEPCAGREDANTLRAAGERILALASRPEPTRTPWPDRALTDLLMVASTVVSMLDGAPLDPAVWRDKLATALSPFEAAICDAPEPAPESEGAPAWLPAIERLAAKWGVYTESLDGEHLALALMEAYREGQRDPRPSPAPSRAEGDGETVCPECNGTGGYASSAGRSGIGGQTMTPCVRCGGSGRCWPDVKCDACGGSGTTT